MSNRRVIADAPVYAATMHEMSNLDLLLARANELALKHGAVRIDPPKEWPRPLLRMNDSSRFFVRMQTLPAAPFVDTNVFPLHNSQKNAKKRQRKRSRSVIIDDDEEEEHAVQSKSQSTHLPPQAATKVPANDRSPSRNLSIASILNPSNEVSPSNVAPGRRMTPNECATPALPSVSFARQSSTQEVVSGSLSLANPITDAMSAAALQQVTLPLVDIPFSTNNTQRASSTEKNDAIENERRRIETEHVKNSCPVKLPQGMKQDNVQDGAYNIQSAKAVLTSMSSRHAQTDTQTTPKDDQYAANMEREDKLKPHPAERETLSREQSLSTHPTALMHNTSQPNTHRAQNPFVHTPQQAPKAYSQHTPTTPQPSTSVLHPAASQLNGSTGLRTTAFRNIGRRPICHIRFRSIPHPDSTKLRRSCGDKEKENRASNTPCDAPRNQEGRPSEQMHGKSIVTELVDEILDLSTGKMDVLSLAESSQGDASASVTNKSNPNETTKGKLANPDPISTVQPTLPTRVQPAFVELVPKLQTRTETDPQQGGIRRRTYPTLTQPTCSGAPYSACFPSTAPAISPHAHLPLSSFQNPSLHLSGTSTAYLNTARASHVATVLNWPSPGIRSGVPNPAVGHMGLSGMCAPIAPAAVNPSPVVSTPSNHARPVLPSMNSALPQSVCNGNNFPSSAALPLSGLWTGIRAAGSSSVSSLRTKKDEVLVPSTIPVDAPYKEERQKKRQLTDDVKESKGNENGKKKRKLEKPPAVPIHQDKNGKLNKKIVFPDSQTPLSLKMYKKKSKAHHQETSKSLREVGRLKQNDPNLSLTDFKWTRKVDQVEEEFWAAMRRGINGKPVTVAYGVDVEAEGAFDTHVMSYVEWHENEKGAQTKRKKGSSKKDGLIPRSKKVILPKSHVGTLNRDGLLRHLPRMPGINHSMFYVGQLFTRFCWHTEDAFLNSVSYLHEGSAEKVWYAVPPEDATLFEQYAAANVFSKDMLTEDETGQLLLMNKTTIFDPVDVRNAGITVYRVVHRPGSFVLTAPRAYHAGFNCGFNIAEAVNFANPTWFPVGREASNFARSSIFPLCVPWEYLLFHEAKALYRIIGNKKVHELHEMTVKHARIVAGELGVIIREGEMAITDYAKKSNCRVALITDIDELVKNNQLGPQFGNGAGMVCSLCTHACHFYAEMCASCTGSFEARCPKHFGEGHQLCLEKNHKRLLVRRHDPVLLLDILCRLEEVAGIKRSATVVAERYRSYIRPWQTPLVSSGLVLRMDLKAAVSRAPPKMLKDKGTKDKCSRRNKAKKRPSLELDDEVEIVHVKKKRRPPPPVIDIREDSPPPQPRSKRRQSSRRESRSSRRDSLAPHPDDSELYVYEERRDSRAVHRSRSRSRNGQQAGRDHDVVMSVLDNRVNGINEQEDCYLYVPPKSSEDGRLHERHGYCKM